MAKESFEGQDHSWMERLKGVREKKVPPIFLKGFADSVESQIRKTQPSLEIQLKPKRTWVPVWTPVLVVLIIGSLLVLRLPVGMRQIPAPVKTIELAKANVTQLSDEIAALREIGAWTDEDEKSAGVTTENDAEDLELSNANINSETQLT